MLQMLEITKLPYVPYFSFGEKLPVIEHGTNDPSGLGYYYENLAALIANGFEDVKLLLEDRDRFIRKASKGRDINMIIPRIKTPMKLLNGSLTRCLYLRLMITKMRVLS